MMRATPSLGADDALVDASHAREIARGYGAGRGGGGGVDAPPTAAREASSADGSAPRRRSRRRSSDGGEGSAWAELLLPPGVGHDGARPPAVLRRARAFLRAYLLASPSMATADAATVQDAAAEVDADDIVSGGGGGGGLIALADARIARDDDDARRRLGVGGGACGDTLSKRPWELVEDAVAFDDDGDDDDEDDDDDDGADDSDSFVSCDDAELERDEGRFLFALGGCPEALLGPVLGPCVGYAAGPATAAPPPRPRVRSVGATSPGGSRRCPAATTTTGGGGEQRRR